MLLTAEERMIKVLRKGDKGKEVGKLQTLLNRVMGLKPPLTVDRDFGKNTKNAVENFQRRADLEVDGVVGKNTWTALFSAGVTAPVNATSTPQAGIIPIAIQYLGARETGDNRMGNDPRMKEIFEADNLAPGGKTDGYAWCAAFVSLCVQKLVAGNPYYAGLKPPREASVYHFWATWAKKEKCLVFAPKNKSFQPAKGDIVVFTFSHIGIVEEVNGSYLQTIEGNTNAAGSREGIDVRRRKRSLTIIRKFIRLPVSVETEYDAYQPGLIAYA